MPELLHTLLYEFPEHAVLIVELISQWNLLENYIGATVLFFTGMHRDQSDLMLRNIPSSKQRLDVIRQLGRSVLGKRPQRLTEFEKVLALAEQRLQFRNRLADGLYRKNANGELCIICRKVETDHTTGLSLNDLKMELQWSLQASYLASALVNNLRTDYPPEFGKASQEIWIALGLPKSTSRE
jgi:hypothetical protein